MQSFMSIQYEMKIEEVISEKPRGGGGGVGSDPPGGGGGLTRARVAVSATFAMVGGGGAK